MKHLYIKNKLGFGNKVFDVIYAIYLHNFYNHNTKDPVVKIHLVFIKSSHDTVSDPTVIQIFPNLDKKIDFISEENYYKIQDIKLIEVKNIDDLPSYEDLPTHTKLYHLFEYAYKMYESFSDADRSLFDINKEVITDDSIFDIIKNRYAIIHIRYGDRVKYTLNYQFRKQNNKRYNEFIMYTPLYFAKMIKKFIKKNVKIVILSDSFNVVRHLIVNKYFKNHPEITNNLILYDSKDWINSFYLLCNASYIALSPSTFSFAGAYLNKSDAECYLLLYHRNSNNILPEYKSLSKKWKVFTDAKYSKYILNYNIKMLKKINRLM